VCAVSVATEVPEAPRGLTSPLMLPGMAAEVIRVLHTATAKQRKEWKVPSSLTVESFLTGGNYLYAPATMKTFSDCSKVLEHTPKVSPIALQTVAL
jgi:hypothetical protein